MYNVVGNQTMTEKCYQYYIKRVEQQHGINSVEASNCYFLVGIYYIE